MMRAAALALALAMALPLAAATRIVVTAVEQKSGAPVTGLTAGDFTVFDDKTARKVEAAEFTKATLDVMLLLDTSLAGPLVQPVVENVLSQLEPKEQMALVSFHSAADLIQDFTSSRELLMRALAKVKYGNEPRVLDALYAAIDGGFQNSVFRRVVLLLSSGVEGDSRVAPREVIRVARRHGVSIFPVFVIGYERSLFEQLARQTGGASFSLRDMKRSLGSDPVGPRLFAALREHYVLTVSGNLSLGEKVRVEVKRPQKLFVSALPLD
jgi:VWFA-related protein